MNHIQLLSQIDSVNIEIEKTLRATKKITARPLVRKGYEIWWSNHILFTSDPVSNLLLYPYFESIA